MRRSSAVVVALAMPCAAVAQDLPRTELGLHVSAHTSDDGSISWSPRITFNFTPLTAVEGTVDVRQPGTDTFGIRSSGQSAGVHLRQALWANDRWQIFGVFGGGISRRTTEVPVQTLERPEGTVIYPAFQFTDTEPALHVGQAVQFDAARRLSLRVDIRLAINANVGLRGMVGGVVPLGRLAAPETRQQALGRRDSLGNGLAIGAASGAVTGAVFFGLMGWALCEDDPCERLALATGTFGAASGAVVGGLIGALIDSLIKGKPAVQVTPAVSPTTRGGHVVVLWR